ncbi:MAG: thiamine diphosphokinase [bacterium]
MHALIILNGNLPESKILQPEIAKAKLIICADGGANQAIAASITPDYIVGDLDSVTGAVRKQLKNTAFVLKPSQYATDLEKALQLAIEKSVISTSVIGFSGGRFHHKHTNLNILQSFSDRLDMTCIDNSGFGKFMRDRISLDVKIGQQISLTAFQKAGGITTKGLKYPLKNGALEWGINDGQSNEAISPSVEITVKKGVLFVFCVEPENELNEMLKEGYLMNARRDLQISEEFKYSDGELEAALSKREKR